MNSFLPPSSDSSNALTSVEPQPSVSLPSPGMPEINPQEPFDLAAFKHAFRRHAAGVAAITTLTPEGKPVGFTATSLASLSAVPPLATFNMARSASTWPAVAASDHVIIHMLGVRNQAIAELLAGPQADRFVGDHWHPGPLGLPVLNGVTSWMLCRVIERVSVHNNAVVVVQVEGGGMGEDDDALLYHERTYRTPGAIERAPEATDG